MSAQVNYSSWIETANAAAGAATATRDVVVGGDLVTNGEFASDTGWTKASGWTIGSGVAAHSGAAGDLSQAVTIVEGQHYRVTFDVSSTTAGSVTPKLGGTSGTAITADATGITEIIIAGSDGLLAFEADADFDGAVDNVVLKKVNSGRSHYVTSISAAYSSTDDGLLTLKQGSTELGRWYVYDAFALVFPSPVKIEPGELVELELAAGTGTGAVNMTGYTL